MPQLSEQQEDLRASIKKNALIWGLVLGLIIAALAYWILSSQGAMLRSGGAAVLGVLAAGGIYKKTVSSGAAGAKCAKCGAGFSVTRSDHSEVLQKSESRESHKELENGDTEITTWVEEVFDVDDTYTCAKCSDSSHKTYQTTRKRDEEVVVKSTAKKAGDQGKGNSKQSAGKSAGKK